MKQSNAPLKLRRTAVNSSSVCPPSEKPEKLQLQRRNAPQTAVTSAETREQQIDALIKKFPCATGACTNEIADRIVIQVASALVWPEAKPNEPDEQLLAKTVAAITEMAPQNATEAMLATQMIAVHEAALMFLYRGVRSQYHDACDVDVQRATRLMRVFGEQLGAMQRLKGKAGQQKVTVEHVHVHQGGQAIVGSVTAREQRGGGGG